MMLMYVCIRISKSRLADDKDVLKKLRYLQFCLTFNFHLLLNAIKFVSIKKLLLAPSTKLNDI